MQSPAPSHPSVTSAISAGQNDVEGLRRDAADVHRCLLPVYVYFIILRPRPFAGTGKKLWNMLNGGIVHHNKILLRGSFLLLYHNSTSLSTPRKQKTCTSRIMFEFIAAVRFVFVSNQRSYFVLNNISKAWKSQCFERKNIPFISSLLDFSNRL